MQFYKEGDILTEEGSEDRNLFVLQEGALGIFKGETRVAVINKPGAIVGEMGMILDEPRTATIKALKHTQVRKIKSTTLRQLIIDHPAIVEEILKTLASRLRNTTEHFGILAHLGLNKNEENVNDTE